MMDIWLFFWSGNSPENVSNLSQDSLELLSNDILGKLELLTASRAQIPLLSTLLIMVEVRINPNTFFEGLTTYVKFVH